MSTVQQIQRRLRRMTYAQRREVARRAKLGAGTVHKVAYGETTSPRWHTVEALRRVLGVE